MTDAPKTLAEQIRALVIAEPLTAPRYQQALGYNEGVKAAATLAEQAAPVRVRDLVWSGDPRWPSTSWAGGYQINEQDADAWRLSPPDDGDELGTGEGQPCSRIEPPDDDAPRGYRPKPCPGTIVEQAGVLVCDECGELV